MAWNSPVVRSRGPVGRTEAAQSGPGACRRCSRWSRANSFQQLAATPRDGRVDRGDGGMETTGECARSRTAWVAAHRARTPPPTRGRRGAVATTGEFSARATSRELYGCPSPTTSTPGCCQSNAPRWTESAHERTAEMAGRVVRVTMSVRSAFASSGSGAPTSPSRPASTITSWPVDSRSASSSESGCQRSRRRVPGCATGFRRRTRRWCRRCARTPRRVRRGCCST